MTNEYVDWIEKSIVDEHINKLIRPIGHNPPENVVYAKLETYQLYFTLRSFNTVKDFWHSINAISYDKFNF